MQHQEISQDPVMPTCDYSLLTLSLLSRAMYL